MPLHTINTHHEVRWRERGKHLAQWLTVLLLLLIFLHMHGWAQGLKTINGSSGPGGGVTTFNTRTGAIIPQLADYSAFFARLSHTHVWTDISNPPATYAPSAHTHLVADVTDFPTSWDWTAIANKPPNYQADWLTTVINKPAIPAAQVNSDWSAVSGVAQVLNKPATYAPTAHTLFGSSHSDVDTAAVNSNDIAVYVTNQWKHLPLPTGGINGCSGTGDKVLFNTTTSAWSCGVDQTSAGGYATLQDEAGSLTARTILNFAGAGVSCADNAGSTRTDCTIAGSAVQLQGTAIDAAPATTYDVLNYNGTSWVHTLLGANNLDTTVAKTGADINTSNQVTVTHLVAPLASAQGGTASAYFAIAGPTAVRTYTFPDANKTIMATDTGVVAAQMPALTGDVTTAAGAVATTIVASPKNYEVAADWSTASTTFSNITGLGWAIGASATQTFICYLGVQDASTTVGMMLGFTGPASPTAITYRADLLLTTQTALTAQGGTAASFPTAIPATACTSSCLASFKLWTLSGVIKNGTNAGTVQLQGKVASGTGKIAAASACWVH